MRAVLDTNVILASQKSANPTSPNTEIIQRWGRSQFDLLYTHDILFEYASKLLEHQVSPSLIIELVNKIAAAGELVAVTFFHLRAYPPDVDDIAFILCATNGDASHLVSYDHHLTSLSSIYTELFSICSPIEFLQDLRKSP